MTTSFTNRDIRPTHTPRVAVGLTPLRTVIRRHIAHGPKEVFDPRSARLDESIGTPVSAPGRFSSSSRPYSSQVEPPTSRKKCARFSNLFGPRPKKSKGAQTLRGGGPKRGSLGFGCVLGGPTVARLEGSAGVVLAYTTKRDRKETA